MGAILSKSKGSKDKKSIITEQDKQLKQQRDKIKQYQKRVNLQLEKEKSIARELLKTGQKEKALLILKKKKRMENTIQKASNQLEVLENMVGDLEFAQIEVEVVKGLQVGNESLKQLHALMSVEQIETILDETREGVEKQREIDDLLMGAFTAEDESDLLAELEELTQEGESQAAHVELPEVPAEEPAHAEEEKKETARERRKERKEAFLAS